MPALLIVDSQDRLRRGRALVHAANLIRDNQPSRIEEALGAYREASDLLESLRDSAGSAVDDDRASAWTNRGIALMHRGGPGYLAQALSCFDRAIDLRTPLAASGNPWLVYNLMGVWVNRGDALVRQGGPEALDGAVASFGEALRLSRDLDLGLHADFALRVALAHLGRGSALLESDETEFLEQAHRSLDAAIEAAGGSGLADSPRARAIAAAAWVGKGEAHGRTGAAGESLSCARRALRLTASLERGPGEAARAGLRARLLLCAIGCRGLSRRKGPSNADTQLDEAIEAAEQGLALARGWPDRADVLPLLRGLFRFGTLAYAVRQPRFLAEFVRENLSLAGEGSMGAMLAVSSQAVATATGIAATEAIISAGHGRLGDAIATLRELTGLREQLEAASRSHPAS